MKSAGRRGNIGPSAGLVIWELTEPADRPAVARPMLRFVFNILAQVTYIQKFIMADSEDDFMPISVAASAAFVAMSQRICRPDVG